MTPKCLPPSVTVVLVLILMTAMCNAVKMNCSQPNQPALLEALSPVFNLSAIRPIMNVTTCTNVVTSFIMYGILGVDEKAQLLVTYLWVQYEWMNEFISWDPIQCGTDCISLPRTLFWVPDIVINEFMDENKAPFVPYVYLESSGKVNDAQPIKVVSSCNLDIYTFPFDIQNCTMTFNSYLHYASDIKLSLGMSAENITELSKNVMTTMGEWQLLEITSSKHKEVYDEDYIDELIFNVRLRRQATLYVVNLLLPSCFLITVDLFSFLLPPHSVDRSSFKMTLILGYTVFLLIMNDLLPITGNTIPLINVFFCICLALMVASLLETILITNLLCGSADFSPVPHWIQVLVLQILGRLVFLPQKTKEPNNSEMNPNAVVAQRKPDAELSEKMGPMEEDKAVQELRSLGKNLHAIRLQVEKHLGESQGSEEWIQVGFIIDRLLFGLYIVFVSVSFITIIIIWCCPLKVNPAKVLFLFISVLMHAPCSSVMLNCSRPDPPSLLEALQPVFKLSSIRPVMNISTPTNVSINFVLYGIMGVDEKTQVLRTYIWQSISWRNEFVRWDPEQCGSSRITIPRTLLWVPDIVINEFMEKNSAPFVPYSYLLSDGMVMDFQPVKVISSCRLDVYKFPFDIQNCSLSFNSYLLSTTALQIDLSLTIEEMLKYSKEVMSTMGEWELVGLTVKTHLLPAGNEEMYQVMRFFVSVKRRATLYVVNLLLPSCFLITVDLFSFLLPPQNVDRSLFKMTLILGYTVFLLIMNDLLPATGDTIPLINVFLCLCLALMVASLLETILITNLLCGSVHYSPVPRWVRVFVLHTLGRLVRLPPKSRDQEDTVIRNPAAEDMKVSSLEAEDSEVSQQKGPLDEEKARQELRRLGSDLQAICLWVKHRLGESQGSEEWIQVGFIIDRLLFGLYIVFISVSFITIIIIWMQSYNTS